MQDPAQSPEEDLAPDASPPNIRDDAPVTWLAALVMALRFLLPLGGLPMANAASWRRAAIWFVPIGMVIGLMWVGVFRAVWRLYGEEVTSLRLVPAAAVVIVDVCFLGYSLLAGLTTTVNALTGSRHAREPENDVTAPLAMPAVIVLLLTIVLELVFLSALRTGAWWWPQDWRSYLNFAYPRLIYRPLFLAPLWGRWAVLLAASVGRVATRSRPEAVGLSAALTPTFVLVSFLFPLTLTAVYCSRSGNIILGTIIALAVLGLTFVASVIIARRGGGQTWRSMLAAGKIAEIIFLAAFVSLSGYIRGW
ncbi:MAG: hypothetical protein JXQ73_18015 [Phycisphaerae bacterium]|nr:hypothetical protein [Phycisphaerae bacterium]